MKKTVITTRKISLKSYTYIIFLFKLLILHTCTLRLNICFFSKTVPNNIFLPLLILEFVFERCFSSVFVPYLIIRPGIHIIGHFVIRVKVSIEDVWLQQGHLVRQFIPTVIHKLHGIGPSDREAASPKRIQGFILHRAWILTVLRGDLKTACVWTKIKSHCQRFVEV